MTKVNFIKYSVFALLIGGIFLSLLFYSKVNDLEYEVDYLKKSQVQKSDSLLVFKNYFLGTSFLMKGSEQEALNYIYQIPESDSLLKNTYFHFSKWVKQNSQKESSDIFQSINRTPKEIQSETLVAYDTQIIQELARTQNDLELAKFKLNELQMANGILELTSSKGKKFQYIGQTKNGVAEGFGVGIFETGSVYKGFWKNNLRHGKGTFIWKDNEQYEGEFNDDKREGYGVYKWKNGEVYEGFWKNDKRNGEGKLFSKSKKVKKEGIWADDILLK